MSVADLWELTAQITEYKTRAETLRETIRTEREAVDMYIQTVDKLVEAQEAERKAFLTTLNKPALELYGGYSAENGMEGGVRIVWRLK